MLRRLRPPPFVTAEWVLGLFWLALIIGYVIWKGTQGIR